MKIVGILFMRWSQKAGIIHLKPFKPDDVILVRFLPILFMTWRQKAADDDVIDVNVYHFKLMSAPHHLLKFKSN